MEVYNHNSIKEWYKVAYKDDELGDNIADMSWSDFWAGLCRGFNMYDIIGLEDSVVRERLFEGLADSMKVHYDVVYYTWLGEYQKALQYLIN